MPGTGGPIVIAGRRAASESLTGGFVPGSGILAYAACPPASRTRIEAGGGEADMLRGAAARLWKHRTAIAGGTGKDEPAKLLPGLGRAPRRNPATSLH